MKLIISLIVLLISTCSIAQRVVNKDVGSISTLKVFDLIVVELIASNVNKVIIKGDDVNQVKIINNNGRLKLRMNLENRFNGDKTTIELYYTSIDVLDANEGATIKSNKIIKQNSIELRSQEGGKIDVILDVSLTKIKVVTGGIIEVSGKSASQEISINSGGIFNGKDLKTIDTKVTITAAGVANIYAKNKVDIKITAGGDVNVYGNPTIVNKKNFAGGRVKSMN